MAYIQKWQRLQVICINMRWFWKLAVKDQPRAGEVPQWPASCESRNCRSAQERESHNKELRHIKARNISVASLSLGSTLNRGGESKAGERSRSETHQSSQSVSKSSHLSLWHCHVLGIWIGRSCMGSWNCSTTEYAAVHQNALSIHNAQWAEARVTSKIVA